MARPISATPTLRGEDAVRFIEAAKNPAPYTHPVLDYNKMLAAVKDLKNNDEKKPV